MSFLFTILLLFFLACWWLAAKVALMTLQTLENNRQKSYNNTEWEHLLSTQTQSNGCMDGNMCGLLKLRTIRNNKKSMLATTWTGAHKLHCSRTWLNGKENIIRNKGHYLANKLHSTEGKLAKKWKDHSVHFVSMYICAKFFFSFISKIGLESSNGNLKYLILICLLVVVVVFLLLQFGCIGVARGAQFDILLKLTNWRMDSVSVCMVQSRRFQCRCVI